MIFIFIYVDFERIVVYVGQYRIMCFFCFFVICVISVLDPTTYTPSPRKILDFHDTNSKSTQDLGFFKNHTRVSRVLAGTCVVFQVLLFFTNASFLSQNYSERQNFVSIALDNSQNLEKKNIFFRAHSSISKSLTGS